MNQYIRKSTHSLEVFFSLIGLKDVVINGVLVNTNSKKCKLFKRKGKIECVRCGLKASYVTLERCEYGTDKETYHFNVYGSLYGMEVLFTRDHIRPKAKGGTDSFENQQIMCHLCNQEKADNIIE